MRRRASGVLVVVAGVTLSAMQACVGGDPGAPPTTEPTDAAAGADSRAIDASDAATVDDRNVPIEASAPRCNPAAAFGAPVSLASLNTSDNDEVARLSPDELTIYFSSDRTGGGGGGFDLWMATRTSRTSTFAAATPVTAINTAGDERDPTVTADGLTLYATISGAGYPAGNNIGVATRASTGASFGAIALAANINADAGAFNSTNPFALPDNSAVYFSSDQSGKADIFRATHVSGSFAMPQAISGALINTPDNNENIAALTPDELTLFFASDRSGGVGFSDIWVATRATSGDPFGAPADVTAVNTGDLDFPSWISADGCVLYLTNFHTPDDGGPRNYDMFVASRGF